MSYNSMMELKIVCGMAWRQYSAILYVRKIYSRRHAF